MSASDVITGTITTQNLVPTGAATAGSAVEVDCNNIATLVIQTVGTYTGALSLQTTVNGTSWVTVSGTPFLNKNTGTYLATITSALESVFQVDVSGFVKARVTALAAVTGTASVSVVPGAESSLVGFSSPLPAGAAAIGSVTIAQPATPTVTTVGDTVTSTTLIAANTSRKEVEFFNGSSAILYLLKGTGTASSTNYTAQLSQGDYYSSNITSAFTGVWASDAAGSVLITESV
jgi:hypothetical protein